MQTDMISARRNKSMNMMHAVLAGLISSRDCSRDDTHVTACQGIVKLMPSRRHGVLFMFVILLSLALGGCGGGKDDGSLTGPAGSPAASASVVVLPDRTVVNQGQTFTRTVQARNVDGAFYAAFDMLYDPAVLEFVKAEEGPFLTRQGADSTSMQTKVQSGTTMLDSRALKRVTIGLTRLGQIGDVIGTGNLVVLTFKAVGAGESPLILDEPRGIKDMSNQEVAINNWVDGTVTVQ